MKSLQQQFEYMGLVTAQDQFNKLFDAKESTWRHVNITKQSMGARIKYFLKFKRMYSTSILSTVQRKDWVLPSR